jgi:hypothetical protein
LKLYGRGHLGNARPPTEREQDMDLGIIAAIAMLVAWAVGTFFFEAPGWLHGLLTVGVFLLIWRIVARGTPAPKTPKAPPAPGDGSARR